MANILSKKRAVLGKALKGVGKVGGMMMKPAFKMGQGMANIMKNETFSRGPKAMGSMMGKKYKKLMGK